MTRLFLLTAIFALTFIQTTKGQIDFTPIKNGDWKISTPEEQELDRNLLNDFYNDASELETLYSLLVIKNGYLIAEKYFNEGAINKKARLASVTKSYVSTLVGFALQQGYIKSLDQKMLEFFPEMEGKITDPRKEQITIRQLLEMRSGYPWEEMTEEHLNILLSGFKFHHINDISLSMNPGEGFQYSNFSSYLLGVITSRARGIDLKTFAEKNLFTPLNVEVGDWTRGWEGYYIGYADIHFTSRDVAKFGLLYLNEGKFEGDQIVPADWVKESFQNYSPDAWMTTYKLNHAGRYFRKLGYGYQWWFASIGDYNFSFAWGHGGQLVVLLKELNMIIVTTADPFYKKHDSEAWQKEKTILNTVGRFILSLSQPNNMPPKIALNDAASSGNVESVKEHIVFGSDLNEKDVYGSTPLIIATTFGNCNVVSELINAGADVNIRNYEGSTALITAAFFGRTEIVKLLLKNGADKSIKNNYGSNALNIASIPFESMKRFYEYYAETLGPFGLKLDYEQIKKNRKKIVKILK